MSDYKNVQPLDDFNWDSFENGTTDITRTFALGPVSDKEKLHYTLTLKGTIGLATAVFPDGTRFRGPHGHQ